MSKTERQAAAPRHAGFALAAVLGLLTATGQAPLGWSWLALVALAAAIFHLSRLESWRSAAWHGWSFGTCYFVGALFWIVEPFLVDIGRHGWMAPFALVFMAGGLALFWAAAAGLSARMGRSPALRAGWLVVTLTGAEVVRSFIFTGFPWALIGHIWIGAPQMQAAALVGAHGLTLLTLAAASVPAIFGERRVLIGVFAGAALAALPGIYGQFRVPAAPAAALEPPVTVRLVQPNAPQHLKWDPDLAPVFYDRQLALTSAAPAPGAPRPDIVIWPETAIPWLLEYAQPAFDEMALAANGAQVVLGLQRRSPDGAWFNSLVVVGADAQPVAVYDKHHLVPFGEYMPLMWVFARMGVFGLATNETGGYTAGPGPQLLDLGAAGRALPLICYEAIFPNDIARAPGRADWLLQITNDAWFGEIAGPWQHMAQARLRAVEQGLPMLRAANTGISAAIDPYGRVTAEIPLGEAGMIDTPLAAALPVTVYARLGDLPVLILIGIIASLLAVMSRRAHSD